MEKKTVQKRIFLWNAWMVLVTLVIFLVINLIAIGVYTEVIEHKFTQSMEQTVAEDALEELLAEYTIHRNEFLLLIVIDGMACMCVLVVSSHIFTKKLVNHIMKPLNLLTDGARKIRNNDLTQNIDYEGDEEFEEVCNAFNEMRISILTEQERVERYEKARTDMIAGISHDLRTPLTAVRGTIKGLLDGIAVTSEQQHKFLQTAYRRTGDMNLLLEQLFYLSKLETGNMPLNNQKVHIADFIRHYVEEKRDLYEQKEYEIEACINQVDGEIVADAKQLTRILDNLLENSRKYAGVPQLKILICLEKVDDNVKIVFHDNGNGVPEDKIPYIFDEFYRGDESRNPKEGNGLGLYIVKYLVEAMGGSVTAGNRDGFSVNLFFPQHENK